MTNLYIGEISALFVSVCWAVSSTIFEKAGRRVGSLTVNYIRLVIAFIMLGIYGLFKRGNFIPSDASLDQWLWLSVSGFFGFFMGDLFLFKAYTDIGARIAMLMMTMSPAFTAVIGYFALNEDLSFQQIIGVAFIIAGIIITLMGREKGHVKFKLSAKGIVFAFLGALGQSLGYIFSKKGIGNYDPFAATQIRIITGFLMFTLLFVVLNHWKSVKVAFNDNVALKEITIGAFFGPGLGVALALYSITLANTGIASALMGLTPIVLIFYSLIRGRRISLREIAGAFVSVGGVVLLFLI